MLKAMFSKRAEEIPQSLPARIAVERLIYCINLMYLRSPRPFFSYALSDHILQIIVETLSSVGTCFDVHMNV